MESVWQLIQAWGLQVLGGIIFLLVGLVVAKTLRGWIRRALERSKLDDTLVPFLSGMVYYLLVVLIVVAVLGLFGVEMTAFIAVLGGAGLAVGLALQGTLSNFASGVMLLIFRPFGVGDYVDAGGTAGTVESIGVFATTLNSPDNV
jgi:small conductance mechanosensitive channel